MVIRPPSRAQEGQRLEALWRLPRLERPNYPDRYPVPHIQYYAHHLSGCSIFSNIELVRAYRQIPVHPDDIQKTGITTPFGLFEFSFMSFGLRNAAQTFQLFIVDILKDLDFFFAYIDDILVYSRSPQEHEQHLRTIFTALQNYGILLNPSKCVFRFPEISFLGYRISSAGSQPFPERIARSTILSFSQEHRPTQTFLGNPEFLLTLPA